MRQDAPPAGRRQAEAGKPCGVWRLAGAGVRRPAGAGAGQLDSGWVIQKHYMGVCKRGVSLLALSLLAKYAA